MIFLPIFALLIGILIGLRINLPMTGIIGNYLAISCMAAMDAVCGGLRSALEKKFQTDIFISGFIANILIAFFLAWLGDRIGLDLLLAIAIILGGRIFTNISIIRRYYLLSYNDKKKNQSNVPDHKLQMQ